MSISSLSSPESSTHSSGSIDGFTPPPSPTRSNSKDYQATETTLASLPPSSLSTNHSTRDRPETQPSRHAVANRLRIVPRSAVQVQEEGEKIARELKELRFQIESGRRNNGSKGYAEVRRPSSSNGWYRRRTWPSYQSLRRTVTGIWHHEPRTVSTPVVTAPNSTSTVGISPAHPSPIPTSPPALDPPTVKRTPSLFSIRRGNHHETSESPTPGNHSFPTHAKRLRRPSMPFRTLSLHIRSHTQATRHTNESRSRSHSFSDFGDTVASRELSAIADDEEELDEGTMEASRVAVEIRRWWVFDDDEAVLTPSYE